MDNNVKDISGLGKKTTNTLTYNFKTQVITKNINTYTGCNALLFHNKGTNTVKVNDKTLEPEDFIAPPAEFGEMMVLPVKIEFIDTGGTNNLEVTRKYYTNLK